MSDRYDNAGDLIHESCGNAHDPSETTCAEVAGEVRRYAVTFVLVDGYEHNVGTPLTADQIEALRSTLDERLHPAPPDNDPAELPLDDTGQPVRPVAHATFMFDQGDYGLIVPADKIVRITWQPA